MALDKSRSRDWPVAAAGMALTAAARLMTIGATLGVAVPASAQDGSPADDAAPPMLAPPDADPLARTGTDPLMAFIDVGGGESGLAAAVARAAAVNPRLDEAVARLEATDKQVDEAVEQRLPTIDIGLRHSRAIVSSFDRLTVESLSPEFRTDATASANQTLFDFGAGSDRVRAARARRSAAGEEIATTRDTVALQTIENWYRIFGYRTLVALGDAFLAEQQVTRERLLERVTQGVLAEGDLARIDSSIAAARARQANYLRELASVEARYAEIVKAPVPEAVRRARPPRMAVENKAAAEAAAERLPEVKAALAASEGARLDSRALRRENLPRVSGSLSYGQYGVLEDQDDYELRGAVDARMRLFGGTGARAARAEAVWKEAQARYARIRDEAVSGAAIAWADVEALRRTAEAQRREYEASRQARDVLFERFRVARGDLFSLVDAQENFFGVAARYVQTMVDFDVALYRLSERTGQLDVALNMPLPLDDRYRAKDRY